MSSREPTATPPRQTLANKVAIKNTATTTSISPSSTAISIPSPSFLILFFLLTLILANHVLTNIKVPKPYMDEELHIPAAQRYCSGNLTYWDPKITTPPGPYVFPSILTWTWNYVVQFFPRPSPTATPNDNNTTTTITSMLCSVTGLRNFSLLWWVGSFLVTVYTLSASSSFSFSISISSAFIALSFLSFSPLVSSANLFYTDTGSLFWVLMTYMLLRQRQSLPTNEDHIKKSNKEQMPSSSSHSFLFSSPAPLRIWSAFLCSSISISFRQTNIVWVGWILLECLIIPFLLNRFEVAIAVVPAGEDEGEVEKHTQRQDTLSRNSKKVTEDGNQEDGIPTNFNHPSATTTITPIDNSLPPASPSSKSIRKRRGSYSASSITAVSTVTVKQQQQQQQQQYHSSSSPLSAWWAFFTFIVTTLTINPASSASFSSSLLLPLLSHIWPLLLPFVGFVYFLYINQGSIVLGDKQAHAPVFHFAQLAYLFATTGFYVGLEFLLLWSRSIPLQFQTRDQRRWIEMLQRLGTHTSTTTNNNNNNNNSNISSAPRRGYWILFTFFRISCVVFLLLWKFSYVHPYTLADNRHWIFVLWTRILGPLGEWGRASLSPFYVLCAVLTLTRIYCATSSGTDIAAAAAAAAVVVTKKDGAATTKQQKRQWIDVDSVSGILHTFVWLLCSAATIIPAHLLEFRYFAIPITAFMLLIWSDGGVSGIGSSISMKNYKKNITHEEEEDSSVKDDKCDDREDTSQGDRKGMNAKAFVALAVTVINILVTVYTSFVFLYRPYTWDDGTLARRMW